MLEFKLNSEPRPDLQKGATKRLRRAGKIPAVYYFHHTSPVAIVLDQKELITALHSKAHVYDLQIGKKSHKCILRKVQYDPVSDAILHVDFMGVSMDELITVSVPIRVTGTAVGVKTFGGILEQHLWELQVKCKATDIPDTITLDVTDLNLGQSINAGQIKLEGVTILTAPTASIVSVVQPTGAKEEEEAKVAAEAAAEEAEGEGEPATEEPAEKKSTRA